jgi:hypothetical protein
MVSVIARIEFLLLSKRYKFPCFAFVCLYVYMWERLRYGLNGRGAGKGKIYLLSTSSRPALGPIQPSIQWAPGAPSPGVKRTGREADHSLQLMPRQRQSFPTFPLKYREVSGQIHAPAPLSPGKEFSVPIGYESEWVLLLFNCLLLLDAVSIETM